MCYTDFLKKKFNVFPYVLQIVFKIKSYRYTPMSPSSHLLLLPLFLDLGFSTIDIWDQILLSHGERSVRCRMCSDDSGFFYPLDRCSSTPFPTVATKMSPHTARCPWETKSSPLKTTSLKLVCFLPADLYASYAPVSLQSK